MEKPRDGRLAGLIPSVILTIGDQRLQGPADFKFLLRREFHKFCTWEFWDFLWNLQSDTLHCVGLKLLFQESLGLMQGPWGFLGLRGHDVAIPVWPAPKLVITGCCHSQTVYSELGLLLAVSKVLS